MNTPRFRVSYPNVFKAKKNDLSGVDEYSVVALFPKGADLSGLMKAAETVMTEKWGPDKTKWPKNLKSPFRDQGEREKEGIMPSGYEKGAVFMNLKSKLKPGLVGPKIDPSTITAENPKGFLEVIRDETEFYAGCWAIADVRPYAYDTKGNRGVSFGLQHLQKVKDGESLGGRTNPESAFAPIVSEDGVEIGKSADSLFN